MPETLTLLADEIGFGQRGSLLVRSERTRF